MAIDQWPQDPDTMGLFPTEEEDLTMLMQSIPGPSGQSELRKTGKEFLKTLRSSADEKGQSRAPSLDEMKSGEIYYDIGGQEGYTIPQPREDVQDILTEYGYTQFMKATDEKQRQDHINKIKKMTGISKIDNEEEYLYGPGGKEPDTIEKLESVGRWMKTSSKDKILIQKVAEGEIMPEEFRNFKLKESQVEEENFMEVMSKLVGEIPSRGGFITERGEKVPTSGANVGRVIRGEEGVGLGFSGGLTTVRNISIGTRGGGKPPKPPVSNLEESLLDKEKLIKGDVPGFKKFTPDVANQIKGDIDILRTAIQLRNKVGGAVRLTDEQAKVEAQGFVQSNDVVSDIVSELKTNPLLAKELKGNPKESIFYFQRRLDVLPNKMYNRIVALLEKNHSFEDILKTIESVTGKALAKETE